MGIQLQVCIYGLGQQDLGALNSALNQGKVLNAASGADTPAELSKSPTESQLCSIYSSRLTNKFLRDVSQKAPQDKVLSQRCRRVWAGFAEAEC